MVTVSRLFYGMKNKQAQMTAAVLYYQIKYVTNLTEKPRTAVKQ